jgi:hypothetical protein
MVDGNNFRDNFRSGGTEESTIVHFPLLAVTVAQKLDGTVTIMMLI